VYGYGNPGRQDDGIGPYLAEEVGRLDLPLVDTDANYQLQIEDAELISQYDLVIFIDADCEGSEPFSARRLEPEAKSSYTTHRLGPESVLALCKSVYGVVPESWLIGVRGYSFDMHEGLTQKAMSNSKETAGFITQLLRGYKGKEHGEQL
jgi:hydrogenase maturation protease